MQTKNDCSLSDELELEDVINNECTQKGKWNNGLWDSTIS